MSSNQSQLAGDNKQEETTLCGSRESNSGADPNDVLKEKNNNNNDVETRQTQKLEDENLAMAAAAVAGIKAAEVVTTVTGKNKEAVLSEAGLDPVAQDKGPSLGETTGTEDNEHGSPSSRSEPESLKADSKLSNESLTPGEPRGSFSSGTITRTNTNTGGTTTGTSTSTSSSVLQSRRNSLYPGVGMLAATGADEEGDRLYQTIEEQLSVNGRTEALTAATIATGQVRGVGDGSSSNDSKGVHNNTQGGVYPGIDAGAGAGVVGRSERIAEEDFEKQLDHTLQLALERSNSPGSKTGRSTRGSSVASTGTSTETGHHHTHGHNHNHSHRGSSSGILEKAAVKAAAGAELGGDIEEEVAVGGGATSTQDKNEVESQADVKPVETLTLEEGPKEKGVGSEEKPRESQEEGDEGIDRGGVGAQVEQETLVASPETFAEPVSKSVDEVLVGTAKGDQSNTKTGHFSRVRSKSNAEDAKLTKTNDDSNCDGPGLGASDWVGRCRGVWHHLCKVVYGGGKSHAGDKDSRHSSFSGRGSTSSSSTLPTSSPP